MNGLRDIRVVDLSDGIAGPYCTKLYADAGADVVKVESASGDPMRRWTSSGADLGDQDGALFRFLNAGKRSVRATPAGETFAELVAGADLLVEDSTPGTFDVDGLLERERGLVVVSITPYGRTGAYAARPWSELTVQAEGGSIAMRGLHAQEPYQAGGCITQWVSGAFAAAATLPAVMRAQRTGHGEHVDLSMLEVISYSSTTFTDLIFRLMGLQEFSWPARTQETPSIEPSADGWVGFNTNSGQQFSDFLVMIGRPDLQGSGLENVADRMLRHDEWQGIVREWTREHGTAQIVELATLLRVPVAPVLDGRSVLEHEHFVARGVFQDDATGSFKQPRRPYRVNGAAPDPPRPSPALGEHDGAVEARPRGAPAATGEPALPFDGLRVVDMTNWWAGPAATQLLASLGADVIHLESPRRVDGVRFTGGMVQAANDQWWECAPFFLSADAGKRSLTLDLDDERARNLLERLVERSDILVDNYSPRVLDGFGFTWRRLQEINPRLSLLRMPAFGLDGPWRDNVGFAQTMDQISGLASLTGHADDQPRIQRGPCDPLGGMTGAFSAMVAIAERDATGRGVHVECPMVEGALNAAAEAVIEHTAYGHLMERMGNRSPSAAPQGLYPCAGHCFEDERWLALSIQTDAQWAALRRVLGDPQWMRDGALAAHGARRARHDELDEHLRAAFAGRELDTSVAALVDAGIPAARVQDPRRSSLHPQMVARGFFEDLDHPVAGRHPVPVLPFRYRDVERWARTRAPTLGQHNREILCDLLGVRSDEYARLEADGVIGTRPAGL